MERELPLEVLRGLAGEGEGGGKDLMIACFQIPRSMKWSEDVTEN